MTDCLFCKMVNGEIKPDVVYENDTVLAFRDINPQAPIHVLVVPKQHIATTNDLDAANADVIAQMHLAAKQIAADAGISDSGYRTVMNCNAGAGQSVYHLHLHVLGGRPMRWPPG
jgi:histidine triad (HIT) family protein